LIDKGNLGHLSQAGVATFLAYSMPMKVSIDEDVISGKLCGLYLMNYLPNALYS